jgi:hypothetical protein
MMDNSQGNSTSGKKKPSPRRVAQEGFMATSVSRHEPTDISGSRDLPGSAVD